MVEALRPTFTRERQSNSAVRIARTTAANALGTLDPRRGDRAMHVNPAHHVSANLGPDPIQQPRAEQAQLRCPGRRLGLDRERTVLKLNRSTVTRQLRSDKKVPRPEDSSLRGRLLPPTGLDKLGQQHAERLRIARVGAGSGVPTQPPPAAGRAASPPG